MYTLLLTQLVALRDACVLQAREYSEYSEKAIFWRAAAETCVEAIHAFKGTPVAVLEPSVPPAIIAPKRNRKKKAA